MGETRKPGPRLPEAAARWQKSAREWIRRGKLQIAAYLQKHRRKAIAGIAALGTLASTAAVASVYYDHHTQTLYHVYVEGKEVGVVNDPELVHEWLAAFRAEQKQNYPGLNIELLENVTFRQEEIYHGTWDNEEALQALANEMDVAARAAQLKVNGKVVGYVADRETLERILARIKARFAPETAADDKKDGEGKKGTLAAASVHESADSAAGGRRVEAVEFKEKVEIAAARTAPEEILTEEEMLRLLQKGTLQERKYRVREGDTLSGIAAKFGLSVKALLQNNPGLDEKTLLQIGQDINVTAYRPQLTVRVVETVQREEGVPFPVELRPDDSLFRGETKVIQEGKSGRKKVTYEIVKENGVVVAKRVIAKEILQEPVQKIVARGTKVKPSRGSGRFHWPTYGGRISSGFGMRWGEMHKGIDISGVSDRSILAADHGKVVFAGWDGGYGNSILIDHGNGFQTRYAHLSEIRVSSGQTVAQGQVIGIMGSTGRSTGVHLHFEVLRNSAALNPLGYVNR
ncbi:M23 family metallopeptidase [Bacillaceae bacterium]